MELSEKALKKVKGNQMLRMQIALANGVGERAIYQSAMLTSGRSIAKSLPGLKVLAKAMKCEMEDLLLDDEAAGIKVSVLRKIGKSNFIKNKLAEALGVQPIRIEEYLNIRSPKLESVKAMNVYYKYYDMIGFKTEINIDDIINQPNNNE
jgi:hypothetical protein